MQDTEERSRGRLRALQHVSPLHDAEHDTRRQDTKHHGGPYEPSRPCRQGHEGCDLNSVNEIEITPHEAVFDGEGNRLLPVTGRGEGVRPRARIQGPHEGLAALGPAPTFPQEINAMELSTNPSPALSALAIRSSFL